MPTRSTPAWNSDLGTGLVNRNEVILDVADQARARDFYVAVLAATSSRYPASDAFGNRPHELRRLGTVPISAVSG